MSTQRKIYHLLKSEGENETFRYLPEFRAPFSLEEPILVTDKVDGSTMQSKGGKPYKRFDLFRKNDPRKHTASEAERYELRLLDPLNHSHREFLTAYNSYRPEFEEFGRRYPDLWIYSEGLSSNIGGRFPGLKPTIRVFDANKNGQYLPFLEILRMAGEVGLPVVPWRWEVFGNLETLLEVLSKDVSSDKELPPHRLEGWVLRQVVNGEEVVAKIRVTDIDQISASDRVAQKNQKLTAADLVRKLMTEQGWICTGGEEIGRVWHDAPNIGGVWASENLVSLTINDQIVMVSGDNMVLVEPWMIQVYQNYIRRLQKPRNLGGAWYEAEIPIAAIRLRNPSIQRIVIAERHAARKAWLNQ